MNKINTSQAILDMQRMVANSQMKPAQSVADPSQPQNFTELLKTAVENVNAVQTEAGELKKSFEMGDPNVDLPQVMVAAQKSSLAFQAMLKVRNDLMQAYKDVMSMPV